MIVLRRGGGVTATARDEASWSLFCAAHESTVNDRAADFKFPALHPDQNLFRQENLGDNR